MPIDTLNNYHEIKIVIIYIFLIGSNPEIKNNDLCVVNTVPVAYLFCKLRVCRITTFTNSLLDLIGGGLAPCNKTVGSLLRTQQPAELA